MPPTPAPLVLASASPRRQALLEAAGVTIEVVPSRVAEKPEPGEAPEALAMRLAREKALEVAERIGPEPERIVLGADTVVVLDGDVLGKPDDAAHATALLARLVGRRHHVITGVAVVSSRRLAPIARAVTSVVYMRAADREEIEHYVASGEPLDKAGAYALQGRGRKFVTRVEGSESNVIGLPVEEALGLVAQLHDS
jgi:septum formation protein